MDFNVRVVIELHPRLEDLLTSLLSSNRSVSIAGAISAPKAESEQKVTKRKEKVEKLATSMEEVAETASEEVPEVVEEAAPEEEPQEPTYSLSDLRAFAATAKTKGVDVPSILKSFKVKKLSDLQESDYNAFHEAIAEEIK